MSGPSFLEQVTNADSRTVVGTIVAAVIGWLGFSKTRRATAQDAADRAASEAEESVYALLKEQVERLSARLDVEGATTLRLQAEIQQLRSEAVSMKFKQAGLIALIERNGITVPADLR